jgi:hypothetical protein
MDQKYRVRSGTIWSNIALSQSVTLPSSFDTLVLGSDSQYVPISRTGVTPAITCPSCANVRMTVSVSGNGSVKIGTTTGLSSVTGYPSANWTAGAGEIAFEGTVANVNAAFATLQYRGARATLSASLSPAGYFFYQTTGNYYAIDTSDRTWIQARAYAEGLTLWGGGVGPSGYLATVTSAGEFNFIKDKAGLTTPIWLGATRFANPPTVDAVKNWYWVAGPEANQIFFNGTTTSDGTGVVGGRYNAWCTGEPNNAAGIEGYLQSTNLGCWNDLSTQNDPDTVVEFTGSGSASNASTTISGPENVPMLSPALLLILASLIAGVSIHFQRRGNRKNAA